MEPFMMMLAQKPWLNRHVSTSASNPDPPVAAPGAATEPLPATQTEPALLKEEENMDIHPPHGPIHTKRDFFIHMLTIVLGILIALGLDGLIEWRHHRALVHEAQANLSTEIRNNKETIDKALPDIRQSEKQLEQISSVLRQVEQGKSFQGNLSYRFIGYEIYSTAWKTAATSGATAYMSYAELKNYTDVYDTQQVFLSLQDRAFQSMADLADLPNIMELGPKKASPARIQQVEIAASRALSVERTVENAAIELQKQYVAATQMH
jgi:hypothetical protein